MIRLWETGNYVSIVVACAIVLHLTWAWLLWMDVSATNATAVHALYQSIPSVNWLIFTLVAVASMAFGGMFATFPWIVLLLIPQEIVLSISAAGALKAMWTGSFADGVLRSNVFIAADQVYSVILAIGHALAIIFHARYTIK